jgi:hypothetical protein
MRVIKRLHFVKQIGLILGFCLFLACVRTVTVAPISPKPKDASQSQVFKAPFYKVFRATFVSLENAGYSIKMVSLEKGIITTDWKKGIEEANDAFFLHDFGYSNIRRRITVNLISLSENSTKVEIQGLIQFGDDFKGWQGTADEMPVEVVKKSCQKYFTAIQQKLSSNKSK